MAKCLLLTITVVLSLGPEILNYILGLTLIDWIIFLGLFLAILLIFRNNIKKFSREKIQSIKLFNSRQLRIQISDWASDNTPNTLADICHKGLEENLFTRVICFVVVIWRFNHFPILLRIPKVALFFYVFIAGVFLVSLAFRKRYFLWTTVILSLVALTPYFLAACGWIFNINPFEGIPSILVFHLHLDTLNIAETANKIFIYIAPWLALIICILFTSSFILRNALKNVFAIVLRLLKSLAPA